MIRTKIDGFQKQKAIFREGEDEDYDIFTKNKMQFSGLECRVLRTLKQIELTWILFMLIAKKFYLL